MYSEYKGRARERHNATQQEMREKVLNDISSTLRRFPTLSIFEIYEHVLDIDPLKEKIVYDELPVQKILESYSPDVSFTLQDIVDRLEDDNTRLAKKVREGIINARGLSIYFNHQRRKRIPPFNRLETVGFTNKKVRVYRMKSE